MVRIYSRWLEWPMETTKIVEHGRLRIGVDCTVPECPHYQEKFEDVWLWWGYPFSGPEPFPPIF